ncbi:distal membrane-arm assembly complex protein 2 [Agrilus planipennis]|uniref:ATP synthase subunit s-like protein n=1 Tax=Agrilus planipennis TaxID=224129 RepID=A0A1W4WU24_AGRPL|nr:distal membrane-arm assembly complex protein 2 [Agrilus planipennis]
MLSKRYCLILNKLREQQTCLTGHCSFKIDCTKGNDSKPEKESSNVPLNSEETKRRVALTNQVTKEDLQWRKPWKDEFRGYFTVFRNFYSEKSNTELIKFLSSPIDLSPSSIKKWWMKKQKEKQIVMQGYIPERVEVLGCELAAAHFIVFRGGAVKFFQDDKWIKADEDGNYSLPRTYAEGKFLQGIDCSEVDLHYEGLVNFRNLRQVEWLSFNNCKYIDDWCLDTISNIFSETLIYLDLRNCSNITHRGIGALHKIKTLKILYLDSMYKGQELEMTCILLQELLPDLDIRMIDS